VSAPAPAAIERVLTACPQLPRRLNLRRYAAARRPGDLSAGIVGVADCISVDTRHGWALHRPLCAVGSRVTAPCSEPTLAKLPSLPFFGLGIYEVRACAALRTELAAGTAVPRAERRGAHKRGYAGRAARGAIARVGRSAGHGLPAVAEVRRVRARRPLWLTATRPCRGRWWAQRERDGTLTVAALPRDADVVGHVPPPLARGGTVAIDKCGEQVIVHPARAGRSGAGDTTDRLRWLYCMEGRFMEALGVQQAVSVSRDFCVPQTRVSALQQRMKQVLASPTRGACVLT
jgi:hypothetical protein